MVEDLCDDSGPDCAEIGDVSRCLIGFHSFIVIIRKGSLCYFQTTLRIDRLTAETRWDTVWVERNSKLYRVCLNSHEVDE